MSSITAADLRFGGRLVSACDAIGTGHLRKAAGIFAEIADELNVEAESTDGLMAECVEVAEAPPPVAAPLPTHDLQMCSRGVHSFCPVDERGWRECQTCKVVNVSPPER